MSACEAPSGIAAPHVSREYALLADGERGILVGPHGDFAWLCFPRWDSDAHLLRADRRQLATTRSLRRDGSCGAVPTNPER